MALEKEIKEMDELIASMEQRIELFETYIHVNRMDADFERFCEEQRKIREEEEKRRVEHVVKDKRPVL